MKFIYFGSSQFSKVVLEGLYNKGYKPKLVVSRPNKPKERGLKLLPTEVSQFAIDNNISCIKPISLKKNEIKEILSKERADFFVVADYGEIIPEELLSLPSVFALCIHPSLLPCYRGAAPIEEVLANGDKKSGVTIFKINEKVDAGDIILQRTLDVNYDDDFFSLRNKLAIEGLLLLIEAIKKIKSKNYSLNPQDDKLATITSKLKKEDGKILWAKSNEDIRNLIRATLGWPSAYTFYKGKMIKILAADTINSDIVYSSGVIVSIDKEGICVATGKGILKIKKVKPQGKNEMDAWSFVCGYRLKSNEFFSSGK